MKDIILVIVIAILLSITMYVAPEHGVIRYDCGISEISPDYPPAVKEECRKLRQQNYQKESGRGYT